MGKKEREEEGHDPPPQISQHNFFILMFKREKYVNYLIYDSS